MPAVASARSKIVLNPRAVSQPGHCGCRGGGSRTLLSCLHPTPWAESGLLGPGLPSLSHSCWGGAWVHLACPPCAPSPGDLGRPQANRWRWKLRAAWTCSGACPGAESSDLQEPAGLQCESCPEVQAAWPAHWPHSQAQAQLPPRVVAGNLALELVRPGLQSLGYSDLWVAGSGEVWEGGGRIERSLGKSMARWKGCGDRWPNINVPNTELHTWR